LLEQVMLRRQRLPRRDLADVAVIRGARGLVVDEHALAVLARPGLELDRAQVGHVLRADDVKPLGAHEPQIGRVLLGLELVGHLLRDDRILGHRGPSRAVFSLHWFTSRGLCAAIYRTLGLTRLSCPADECDGPVWRWPLRCAWDRPVGIAGGVPCLST